MAKIYDMQTPLRSMGIKKSYRDISGELNIDNKTIYNWRRDPKRHKLLDAIVNAYRYDKIIKIIKESTNE